MPGHSGWWRVVSGGLGSIRVPPSVFSFCARGPAAFLLGLDWHLPSCWGLSCLGFRGAGDLCRNSQPAPRLLQSLKAMAQRRSHFAVGMHLMQHVQSCYGMETLKHAQVGSLRCVSCAVLFEEITLFSRRRAPVPE